MYGFQHLLQLIFLRTESQAHASFRRRFLTRHLAHIRIDDRHRAIFLEAVHPVEYGSSRLEEEIVEVHHICQTAVVGVKYFFLMAFKLVRHNIIQQFPVRASPAVDALLDVSDYQALASLGLALMKQRAEIAPLHTGSILELVKKEMFITDSQLLIHERSIRTVDYVTKNRIGIIDTENILFLHQLLERLVKFACNSESIKLSIKYLSRIIYLELLVKESAEILQRGLQERIHQRLQLCSLSLREPLFMIKRLGYKSLRKSLDRISVFKLGILIELLHESPVALSRIHSRLLDDVKSHPRRVLHSRTEIRNYPATYLSDFKELLLRILLIGTDA